MPGRGLCRDSGSAGSWNQHTLGQYWTSRSRLVAGYARPVPDMTVGSQYHALGQYRTLHNKHEAAHTRPVPGIA
eukprot:820386-Rhodomonas_salina.2